VAASAIRGRGRAAAEGLRVVVGTPVGETADASVRRDSADGNFLGLRTPRSISGHYEIVRFVVVQNVRISAIGRGE